MFKKVTLATAILMALTACSSGGSDSAQPTNQLIEQNGTTNSGNSSSNNANTGSNSNAGSPSINPLYTETVTDPNFGGSLFSTFDQLNSAQTSGAANSIIVDGKSISLQAVPAENKGALTYSQYGWFMNSDYIDTDNSGDISTFVYSHGQLTDADKVPTTGSATYLGKGLHGASQYDGFIESNAAFFVDFANKTVYGSVANKEKGLALQLPDSKISGNSFNGQSGDTHINGRFFGPNAEEIGGTYYNNKEEQAGAFSAAKQ